MEQEYIDCIERIRSEVDDTTDIDTLTNYINSIESILHNVIEMKDDIQLKKCELQDRVKELEDKLDTATCMIYKLEKDRTTLKEFMRVLGYREPGFPERLLKGVE